MSAKTKRILSIVMMTIPTLVLIMGGIMKILDKEPEMVMQFLTNAGFGNYITLLGLTEIVIAAMIIYPKTNKIGYLLATAYLGGAFSMEISGKQVPASAVFLAILWIGMFLRDKEMFFTTTTSKTDH